MPLHRTPKVSLYPCMKLAFSSPRANDQCYSGCSMSSALVAPAAMRRTVCVCTTCVHSYEMPCLSRSRAVVSQHVSDARVCQVHAHLLHCVQDPPSARSTEIVVQLVCTAITVCVEVRPCLRTTAHSRLGQLKICIQPTVTA